MILPLLAVVFALASAFASANTQSAWFHEDGEGVEGTITNTTEPCFVGGDVQCTIGSKDAYNSRTNAAMQEVGGLLKYDN